MTRPNHLSGTDRVAEVASARRPRYVNIQGDEPLIDPAAIDAAILALHRRCRRADGHAARRPIRRSREITESERGQSGHQPAGDAIYFSRCPIPFEREGAAVPVYYKHIGLYVYRRDFLLRYPDLPVGPLEQAERLEQLRAIENGYRIRVVETEYESLGVDTPEDLERVNRSFRLISPCT